MFPSVRAPRVFEHIVAQIERAIFDGRLQPGDKLPPERQLARQFGASRVAVREALRALEYRGIVDVRHGATGGYFIREADGASLVRDLQTLFRLGRVSLPQLLEARLLIEPEAARLAAERAGDAEVKSLAVTLDARAERAAAGPTGRGFDLEFHRELAAAAGNPVHALVIAALMELEMHVVAPPAVLAAADDAAIDAGHREVLDAVAARQPERARAAMDAHIRDVERRFADATPARIAS